MPKKTRYIIITALIIIIITLFFFKRPYDGEILDFADETISMYENSELKAFAYQELAITLFEMDEKEKSHHFAKKASENLYNTGIDHSNSKIAQNLARIFSKLEDNKNADYYAEKLINMKDNNPAIQYLQTITAITPYIKENQLKEKVKTIAEEYENKIETYQGNEKIDIIAELYKINYELENTRKTENLRKLFVNELLQITEPLLISAKYSEIADFFLHKNNSEEFLKLIIVIPSEEIRITKLIEGALHFYNTGQKEEALKYAELINIENIMKIRRAGLVTNLLINYSEVAYKLELKETLDKIEEYYEVFIDEYDTYERVYFEISKLIILSRNKKYETVEKHTKDMIEIIENYPDEHMKTNSYVALISALTRANNPVAAIKLLDKVEINNVIELVELMAVKLSEIEECTQALKLTSKINDPVVRARTLARIHKNFETFCQRGLTFTEKNYLR
ncbi:MAG: hypothetical protein WC337_11320 [Candidatus Muiribacteriota bacterium]